MLVKKKRTLNFHQGSFYSCLVRLVSCPLCIICANTSSYFIHILNNRTCSELASVIAKLNNLFVQQAPPACRLQTCLYATRNVAASPLPHEKKTTLSDCLFWCGQQDLNLHGVTTRSLVLRVCQFRHDRSQLY